jgi:DNA-nicking Smr family endonuclease
MKVKSLADLGALRRAVQQADAHRAAEAARRQAEARARERRAQVDQALFARTVGPVHPLRDRGLAELDLPRPPPRPRQRELDEQAALAATLSDEVTLESLLLTDDGLSFRRPGIGPDVVTRLRKGHWALQGQIDLHGLNREEARETLSGYVRECHRRGMRCLRVVHGKGHGSPGRQPVLKAKVQRRLAPCAAANAYAQPTGPQGGAGALVLLLAGR